jgi:hypothetical protein
VEQAYHKKKQGMTKRAKIARRRRGFDFRMRMGVGSIRRVNTISARKAWIGYGINIVLLPCVLMPWSFQVFKYSSVDVLKVVYRCRRCMTRLIEEKLLSGILLRCKVCRVVLEESLDEKNCCDVGDAEDAELH